MTNPGVGADSMVLWGSSIHKKKEKGGAQHPTATVVSWLPGLATDQLFGRAPGLPTNCLVAPQAGCDQQFGVSRGWQWISEWLVGGSCGSGWRGVSGWVGGFRGEVEQGRKRQSEGGALREEAELGAGSRTEWEWSTHQENQQVSACDWHLLKIETKLQSIAK